jgi:cytochrome oxidase assembly protein ShyY1
MTNWHFAFTRRWFGYLAMAIVFAIACVLLSNWQFDRKAETKAENDLVAENYSRTPQPIADVLPALDSYSDTNKWVPVTATGTYLVDDQLLVRNRSYNGNPGFEVLTPLQLANGDVFVVDRGWVSTGEGKTGDPDAVPAPPTGEVTVVARIRQGEPSLPGRTAPAGQIPSIELDEVAKTLGLPTYTGSYGLMDHETPSAAGGRPVAAIKPELDEGLHLSYALQWIFFALLGFFGLGYALRQEFRLRNADDPDEMVRAEKRRVKDEARERTDAEVEDELLDSMR